MAGLKTRALSILEVGPRDGLQNESARLSFKDKEIFILKLAEAGLRRIEIGSFVSPKAVPQMAETGPLAKKILSLQKSGVISKDVQFSALTPNRRGLADAALSGLKEVVVFSACSDGFCQKNLNCSVEESFNIYGEVCRQALSMGMKVRGYLSTAFRCPFDGATPAGRVAELARKMKSLGVYEIALSDTTGTARPGQVESLLKTLSSTLPLKEIALHFHDGLGLAPDNVKAGFKMGVTSFDGSVGGLGGCPHSPVRAGNVPTEKILQLLSGPQDPRIPKLRATARWLKQKLHQQGRIHP